METSTDKADGLRVLRGPLRLTWAGMWAEALVQALWPMLTLVLALLALTLAAPDHERAGWWRC